MKKQRSLTIREMADAYLLRQGRVTSRPAIRLQGSWLAQAGFEAGQKVTVHVEDGRIVITPRKGWPCVGLTTMQPHTGIMIVNDEGADAMNENAFLAFIFDPPLEGKLAAFNTVIEEAHRRRREVRFWIFDHRLIVCVAVPDIGVDTGMDLYNALQARGITWSELECAAPAEFYQAPAVPPGHKLLVSPVG